MTYEVKQHYVHPDLPRKNTKPDTFNAVKRKIYILVKQFIGTEVDKSRTFSWPLL